MDRRIIGRKTLSILVAALLLAVSYTLMTAYTTFGYGFNAQPPLAPVAAPAGPTNVVAVAGNKQATVSWTAPAAVTGKTILSYRVETFLVGIPVGTIVTTAATEATVSGLDNGVPFKFKVQATYTDFTKGDVSAFSNEVTPADNIVGLAPTNVVAVAGKGSITVSWTPPNDPTANPILGYRVKSNPAGFEGNSATATIKADSGLTPGTSYTFTVKAVFDGIGDGAESAPSNAVTMAAGPLTSDSKVRAVAGDAKATVSWTATTILFLDNDPLVGYRVTSDPGGITVDTGPNTLSATVSGLTNGTSYTFTVKAKYDSVCVFCILHFGLSSAPSNPVTPPGAVFTSDSTASAWLATQHCPDAPSRTQLEVAQSVAGAMGFANDVVNSYTPASAPAGLQIPNPLKFVASGLSQVADGAVSSLGLDDRDAGGCQTDRIEQYLNSFVEQRRLQLQVIELKDRTKFYLSATLAGKPAQWQLESVQVLDAEDVKASSGSGTSPFKNITSKVFLFAENDAPGVYQLIIPEDAVVGNKTYMKKVDLYRIVVKHDEGNGVVFYGSLLFDRVQAHNLALGQ